MDGKAIVMKYSHSLVLDCFLYLSVHNSWCTVGHFKIFNFDITLVLYITAQNIEEYG